MKTVLKKEIKQIDHALDEYVQGCPYGLYKLFITSMTQNDFNIRTDEDITQEDSIRYISKAQVLEDIGKKGVASDFSPLKKLFEEFPEDEIMIIYDYDFQFDKNFYFCLDLNLKEIINNVKKLKKFFLIFLFKKCLKNN